MGIALERELEDDEEDEILNVEEDSDEAETRKRKAENLFEDLLDTEDASLRAEIDELVHEEEEMLVFNGGEEEDDDQDASGGRETPAQSQSSDVADVADVPSKEEIVLLDDDDDDDDDEAQVLTFSAAMQQVKDGRLPTMQPAARCVSENIIFKDIQYPAFKSLGLLMVSFGGRVCIKGYTEQQSGESQNLNRPQVGAIIVAVNETIIPHSSSFHKVLAYMRKLVTQGPITLVFAEDKEFMPWFRDVMIPRFDARVKAQAQSKAPKSSGKTSEVIDLLDD